MLQEKHSDLIHFGMVTCNTISGKIKLEGGQCWQSETRQKKYEASGLEFKNHKCGSSCQISPPQVGVRVFLPDREAKKEVGMTYSLPDQLPSPSLDLTPSVENTCTDRPLRGSPQLQSFPLAQPGSWSSLIRFIVFFFSVEHSHKFQTPKVNLLCATALPNKCAFTALERSTTKCAFDYLHLSLPRSSYSWIC